MLVENETIYLQRIVHSHNTDNNDGYDEILYKLKKSFVSWMELNEMYYICIQITGWKIFPVHQISISEIA